MALQAGLFTLSALAVELNCAIRTISRAMEGIPAEGHRGKYPCWRIATASAALAARRKRWPNGAGGNYAYSSGPAADDDDSEASDAAEAVVLDAAKGIDDALIAMRATPDIAARRELAKRIGPHLEKLTLETWAAATGRRQDDPLVRLTFKDMIQDTLGCALELCRLTLVADGDEAKLKRKVSTRGEDQWLCFQRSK